MLSQVPEAAVWAIFFLPVISLITIMFVFNRSKRAGIVAAVSIGVSFLLSLWVLDSAFQADGEKLEFASREWLSVGGVHIEAGLNVDGLTAIMLVVVTSVAFLVQVYSLGYMAGDPGYWRYFAYMSLFTASMLGLVLVNSLVLVYVFWELVGLSSFLLIGFWFHRPAAAAAAKKAFLVTRLGDIGFLLAILLIYAHHGTFDIEKIQYLAITGAIGGTTLTFFALGIFAGAAGKSAQVPFHVWLPDAMEGPTPVSALIHAATMVVAGVYLVARLFPVFQQSPDAMTMVAAVGGITAITGALIALVMTDIKRVLAYSTISQLGYMMLALGIGAYVAAIFHLLTHAFFKALLFLGSGSVNHATNTFDMRRMGGLRKSMPITFWTFVIASISLSGLFPFAGFWSKDEILSDAWAHGRYLFYIALLVAGLTAFYMFRVIFLTFGGEYRGGGSAEDGGEGAHASELHESPQVMTIPLLVLAVPAALIGFANIDKDIEHLLVGNLELIGVHIADSKFRLGVAVASTILPLLGISLAYAIYSAKIIPAPALSRISRPLHKLLENKFYLDALYERVIVETLFYRLVGGASAAFDSVVVDGAAVGVGRSTRQAGLVLRFIQNGQFQTYGAMAFGGLVLTALIVLVLNPL